MPTPSTSKRKVREALDVLENSFEIKIKIINLKSIYRKLQYVIRASDN